MLAAIDASEPQVGAPWGVEGGVLKALAAKKTADFDFSFLKGLFVEEEPPPVVAAPLSSEGGGALAGGGVKCANCGTTDTPGWRCGETPEEKLCNSGGGGVCMS